MMNKTSGRLLNAALIVVAALSPSAVFAQDTAMADPNANASGAIGMLVVWLLAIGGIIAVGVMTWADKTAQAGRSITRR